MIVYPKAQWHIGTSVVFFKLSEQEMLPLHEEKNSILDQIKNNSESLQKRSFNGKLVGQIEHEYLISSQVALHIEKIMQPAVRKYVEEYSNSMFLSLDNLDNIVLPADDCWINFQKKHEYNPLHKHNGFLSFVIWIEIPYKSQDEMNQKNSIRANNLHTNGDFWFVQSNNGTLHHVPLKIDESWNARGAIFSAGLSHIVYPFYTSDQYRVSIAGNYKIR